jgi:uncharacterized protein
LKIPDSMNAGVSNFIPEELEVYRLARVLNWDITVPYQWTCGPIYGQFLGGLKEKQIMGIKCGPCGKTYCPPQETCPGCGAEFDPENFVTLGQEGEVISFTRIEVNFFGPPPDHDYINSRIYPAELEDHPLLWPPEPPYALALVRMDGADNAFLHLVKGADMENLAVGGRVRAVWSEEREGYLLDLERFTVI